ncbi:tetratricopeptide repeat protein [Kibdelosporangium aridum]|uniref:Tetratricopeptide repeat-containing protein n=1 Tax=Kibdelosporangium aridum TaxID=2030 RepID=A0A1W2FNX3_KIBAR|nr:tetratricopeptide repeat protein [Kibdelosporangium aridum]SMD23298.1 Tetratricopeptide repeat-containing protein [Kibdelosporangium aridum]
MTDFELSGSFEGGAAQNIYGSMSQLGDVSGPGWVSVTPPFARVEHAVRGRDKMLDQLEKFTGLVVLSGAGGFGKTTVALALAARMKSVRKVWWVDATTSDNLVAGMREVALSAGAPRDDVSAAWRGEMSAPDLLWRKLDQSPPWLLVIDNADEPSLLKDWIRVPERGLLLVTSRESRNSVWGRRARVVPVPVLSQMDGGAVLHELAPEGGTRAEAETLAAQLGGLPLALLAAGNLLKLTRDTPELPGVDEPKTFVDLMDQIAAVTVDEQVARTWELSLDALERRGFAVARPLLRLLSFMAPQLVPTMMLDAAIMSRFEMFSEVTPQDVAQALRELIGVGLVTHEPVQNIDCVTMHPLVGDATRHHVDAVQDVLVFSMLYLELVRAGIISLGVLALTHLPRMVLLLRHSNQALDIIGPNIQEILDILVSAVRSNPTGIVDGEQVADSLRLLSQYFGELGQLLDGLSDRLFLLDSETLGPEDPVYLSGSGELLLAPGAAQDGEVRRRGSYEKKLARLDAEEPVTQRTRFNRAFHLKKLGRVAEAETEYRAILATQGDDVSESADLQSSAHLSLAYILLERGDRTGAEAELRAVLAEDTSVLDARFPGRVQHVEHVLACLAWLRGDTAEAEADFRRIFADCSAKLGPEHTHTQRAHHFMAYVTWQRGDLTTAETEFRRLVADCRRVLGERNPRTVAASKGLAAVVEERRAASSSDL